MCGGGGGCFQGEGQEKILLSKGGGVHYMKNKNIRGGGVLSTQPDQQKKAPMQNPQKRKKLSNIENFFLARSLPRHFTKFIYLEQLTAMPQFSMQNIYIYIFFFLNIHHDTIPLLHLYHFRETNIIIYWLIFTVNYQGSYFPFFFFFFLFFIHWSQQILKPFEAQC